MFSHDLIKFKQKKNRFVYLILKSKKKKKKKKIFLVKKINYLDLRLENLKFLIIINKILLLRS
jgi:hypothetical protein